MSRKQPLPRVDMRAFRWQLHPLGRKLDAALETARLALAQSQVRQHELHRTTTQWEVDRVAHERHAAELGRNDPRLRQHALGYLAALQQRGAELERQATELQRQLAQERQACADRQRQLACVEALRREAQRQHALTQSRREAREADSAWLALDLQRRAAKARCGEGAA